MKTQKIYPYRLIALAVILFFLLMPAVSGQSAAADMSASQDFTRDPAAMEAAAASVVKLEVFDKNDERIAVGTGFCAFDEETLVTAAHVVVNMEYMIATRDDGSTFRVDGLVNADETTDTALCRLPEEAALPVLPAAAGLPMRGEPVAVIGTMYGIANLVLLGNVSGIWTAGSADWILFTAPVSPGCSGGPLLNDAGEVVGIIAGSYESAESLKLAAPMSAAELLLP